MMLRSTVPTLPVGLVILLGLSTLVFGSRPRPVEAVGATAHVRFPAVAVKEAILQRELARIQRAREHPTPKPSNPASLESAAPPLPGPTPSREAGIQDLRQGDFSPLTFAAVNFWAGPVSGPTWALVWAGQEEEPTVKAAVRVELQTSTGGGNYDYQYVGTFPAPTAADSVRLVAWQGTVLTLTTPSGQTLTFNVATDRYGP
jgi:hypothetical protein